MPNLTTRVKVKRALGVPSGVTQHDDYIDDLLSAVDTQIINYCGMTGITATTVTELYDIPTRYENEVVLDGFPVTAVASVVSAGETLTTATYYTEMRSGVVRLKDESTWFPEGRQKVEVTYTFGAATAEADLSHAATILVAYHFNTSRHAGYLQEAAGGYRYKLDGYSIPPAAAAILAQYRRLTPKGSI